MENIIVGLGDRSYPIFIGTNLEYGKLIREALPKVTDVMVVTNDTVGPLYFEHVKTQLESEGFCVSECVLKDGEVYKTIDSFISPPVPICREMKRILAVMVLLLL